MSSVALLVAMDRERRERAQQLDRIARELAALERAVAARAVGAGLDTAVNGRVDRPAPSAGRLAPEDVEAIAARVTSMLQHERTPVPPPPGEAGRAPAPMTREEQEVLARVTTRVEAVLAAGRMTAQDVREIRRELAPIATRPEVAELRRRLVVAVNQRKLRPPEDLQVWLP